MAEINVTPFIDIMLVLLIVFMLAAPLLLSRVPLSLPKTGEPMSQPPPSEPIVLSLDRQGRIYLGEDELEESMLSERLRELNSGTNGRPVMLRCDKELPYGRVMLLLGRLGQGGVGNVSLLSEASAAGDLRAAQ